MKNYTKRGGIIISKNANRVIWAILFVSLFLSSLPCVGAKPGICPNYYGPYEPNPIGQRENCENMMDPGTYSIRWAHGLQSEWDWQNWDQVDMKANTRYVLIYDSMGILSIDESYDSSLTGYTVICGRNEGPDELVFCLEPA